MLSCKRNKGFKVSNIPFVLRKIETILGHDSSAQRQDLEETVGSDGFFHFIKEADCVKLLSTAFYFPSMIQILVKTKAGSMQSHVLALRMFSKALNVRKRMQLSVS